MFIYSLVKIEQRERFSSTLMRTLAHTKLPEEKNVFLRAPALWIWSNLVGRLEGNGVGQKVIMRDSRGSPLLKGPSGGKPHLYIIKISLGAKGAKVSMKIVFLRAPPFRFWWNLVWRLRRPFAKLLRFSYQLVNSYTTNSVSCNLKCAHRISFRTQSNSMAETSGLISQYGWASVKKYVCCSVKL